MLPADKKKRNHSGSRSVLPSSLRNPKSIEAISIPSTLGIKYLSINIRRSKQRIAPVSTGLGPAAKTPPNQKNIRNAPHIQKI